MKAFTNHVQTLMLRARAGELVMSRWAWGSVLGLTACLLVLAGLALEYGGLRGGLSPAAFVGSVIIVKFALFAAWPSIHQTTRQSGALLRNIFTAGRRERSLKLWSSAELRLQQSLFTVNVPTFVLSNDQRFLDWNAAFDMIFCGDQVPQVVRRGGHVKEWYRCLDNYRRIPKRTDQLYGEGILPITDRERVTFISPKYGRMVFSRIMSPVVDRASGRIIGWTVVLNINSVNKRQAFFEDLYHLVASETHKVRYAASYDGVMGRFPGRQLLLEKICNAIPQPSSVIEIGCGTGALTGMLAGDGHRVTSVDADVHLLRIARERCSEFDKVKFVRKNLSYLVDVPTAKFDVAILNAMLMDSSEVAASMTAVARCLTEGGLLMVYQRADYATLDSLFDTVKASLENQGRFDNLKHQFSVVAEFHATAAMAVDVGAVGRETAVVNHIRAVGLDVVAIDKNCDDGQTTLILARK